MGESAPAHCCRPIQSDETTGTSPILQTDASKSGAPRLIVGAYKSKLEMDRTERFYKIDQLIQARRIVPKRLLMEELGVSRATVVRDIKYLRDRLNAPIVWDRAQRGYRYEAQQEEDPSYALPGLWFNASEAHALLTMGHLLSTLQAGLQGPHIEPPRVRAVPFFNLDSKSSKYVSWSSVCHKSRNIDQ